MSDGAKFNNWFPVDAEGKDHIYRSEPVEVKVTDAESRDFWLMGNVVDLVGDDIEVSFTTRYSDCPSYAPSVRRSIRHQGVTWKRVGVTEADLDRMMEQAKTCDKCGLADWGYSLHVPRLVREVRLLRTTLAEPKVHVKTVIDWIRERLREATNSGDRDGLKLGLRLVFDAFEWTTSGKGKKTT